MKLQVILVSGALTLALYACDDHTADVPAATVASETPGADSPVADTPAADTPAAMGAPARVTLPIDAARSSVGFTGAKITGSHDGTFGQFSGSVELDSANLLRSTVRVEIQMSSVAIEPARLRTHLVSDDFFGVETHPTATFVSTQLAEVSTEGATHLVTGDLTLHGQTRSISFPATIHVSAAEVHANAEFSINRRDFEIVYPGMPDDLIRDEVVIRFDVHAPRS